MWFYRIVIASCVFNCSFQVIYDLTIYIRGSQNFGSCDLIISGSEFANEFVWFLSRSNACYLWMLPLLYVFVPRFKCCGQICFKKRRYGGGKRNQKKAKIVERGGAGIGDDGFNHKEYITDDDYSNEDDRSDDNNNYYYNYDENGKKRRPSDPILRDRIKRDSILNGLETEDSE